MEWWDWFANSLGFKAARSDYGQSYIFMYLEMKLYEPYLKAPIILPRGKYSQTMCLVD